MNVPKSSSPVSPPLSDPDLGKSEITSPFVNQNALELSEQRKLLSWASSSTDASEKESSVLSMMKKTR